MATVGTFVMRDGQGEIVHTAGAGRYRIFNDGIINFTVRPFDRQVAPRCAIDVEGALIIIETAPNEYAVGRFELL